MTDRPLLIDRKGGAVTLTLNRPEAGNAIDLDLAHALMEAAILCDEDDAIKCVVLTGAGKIFCAGGDVTSFAAALDQVPALLKKMTGYLHMAISRFSRMGKPFVTAINGPAAGAGFSLAILGDFALASRGAHFTLAYNALGLSPDGGATWLLPRLIGLRRTQELILTNKRVPADEAVTLGLVTRAVDDTLFNGEVASLTGQLASAATYSLGRARNLLLSSFDSSLETQMELEARAIAACARGVEGRNGIAAFLAKRKPDFTS